MGESFQKKWFDSFFAVRAKQSRHPYDSLPSYGYNAAFDFPGPHKITLTSTVPPPRLSSIIGNGSFCQESLILPETPSATSRTATRKHSWAGEQQAGANRTAMLGVLGFLIVASLLVFVWFIRQGEIPKIYVVRINVPEYPTPIPQMTEKSLWNHQAWKEHWDEQTGLIEWKLWRNPWDSGNENLSSGFKTKEEILGHIESIREALTKSKEKVACLVVQLRCHAAVTNKTKGEKNDGLELLVADNNNATDKLFFDEFVAKLYEVPASNILVLADICDLQYLPSAKDGTGLNATGKTLDQEDWVAPTIAKQLAESLKVGAEDPSRNLWVMCSSADGQTPILNRKGESLFQKACLESLTLNNASRSSIDLADYYRRILGYVNHESKETQTPLLFLANAQGGQICEPSEPITSAWKKSQAAEICLKNKWTKNPTKGENKKDDSNSEGAEASSKQNQSATQKPEKKNSPDDPSSKEPPERDFWSIVDELRGNEMPDEKSTTGWQWKPYDFAPSAWRRLLHDEALAFTKQWANEGSSRELGFDLSELEKLLEQGRIQHPSQQTDTPPRPSLDVRGAQLSDFKNPWVEFQKNPAKEFWEHPDRLPADEPQQWQKLRDPIRAYADALIELIGWRDTISQMPKQTPKRMSERVNALEVDLEEPFSELLKELKSIRELLPSDQTGSFLQKVSLQQSWLDTNAQRIGAWRVKLKQQLDKIIKELERLQEWTWYDDCRCVAMLRSPVLDHVQRDKLLKLRDKRTEKNVSLRNLTDGETKEILSRRKVWWERGEETRKNFKIWQAQISSLRTSLSSNEETSSSDIAQWHRYALADASDLLSKTKSSVESSGIVFYPGDPNAVRIEVAKIGDEPGSTTNFLDFGSTTTSGRTLELSEKFDLTLKPFVNKTPAKSSTQEVKVKWEIDPPTTSNPISISVNGERWDKSTPRTLQFKESTRLEIGWDLGIQEKTEQQMYLKFESLDSNGVALGYGRFPLYRNAERIDVLVRDLMNENEVITPTETLTPNNVSALILKSPAIIGVEGPFKLELTNKLPKTRIARVRMCRDSNGASCFAESKKEKLLAASRSTDGKVQPSMVPISNFTPPAGFDAAEGNRTPKPSSIYCVVEEFEPEDDAEESSSVNGLAKSPSEVSNDELDSKPKNKYVFELKLEAISPGELFELKASRTPPLELGERVEFKLESKNLDTARRIENYEWDELPIELEWEEQGDDNESKQKAIVMLKRAELKKGAIKLDFQDKDKPTIRNKNKLRLAFSVGGYPRSHFFKLDGDPPVRVTEEPFRPYIPDQLDIQPVLEVSDPETRPLEQPESKRWVFQNYGYPNNDPLKPSNKRYLALTISGKTKTHFDAKNSSEHLIPWSLTENSKPVKEGKWSDRQKIPSFDWDKDNRVWKLGFKVTEMDGRIELPDGKDSKTWVLSIGEEPDAKKWTLVFDREAPFQGKIEWDPMDEYLYEDDEPRIQVVGVKDNGESGLDERVFVTLEMGNGRPFVKKELPAKLSGGDTLEEIILWSEESPEIKSELKKLPPDSDFTIRVVTFDKAGNQHKNPPSRTLKWGGKMR